MKDISTFSYSCNTVLVFFNLFLQEAIFAKAMLSKKGRQNT